ncbi:DUF4190 domain-containing protein [Streptomyces sp. NPDC059176]|uniref:DUF4190 domain-containing protein n=1 Tax=unclassified Streptomyces TaxID=2593676 RepID=UPI0036AD6E24
MSDQSAQPGGYQPKDPWAPPEGKEPQDRVDLGKPAHDALPGPQLHDQPTVTSMPGVAPYGAPGAESGSGAVPPPPVAPGGPAQTTPGAFGAPSAGVGAGYGYPPAPVAGATGYGYPSAPVTGAAAYGYPGYPGGGSWGMANSSQNGMGTAAMVLGILAVCLCWCYGVPGVVMGVLALIFGIMGRKRYRRGEATNNGQALAGIILGAIGALLGLLFIVGLVFLITHADEFDESSSDDDPWATTLVVEERTAQ